MLSSDLCGHLNSYDTYTYFQVHNHAHKNKSLKIVELDVNHVIHTCTHSYIHIFTHTHHRCKIWDLKTCLHKSLYVAIQKQHCSCYKTWKHSLHVHPMANRWTNVVYKYTVGHDLAIKHALTTWMHLNALCKCERSQHKGFLVCNLAHVKYPYRWIYRDGSIWVIANQPRGGRWATLASMVLRGGC